VTQDLRRRMIPYVRNRENRVVAKIKLPLSQWPKGSLYSA
jgi:hypothetical protein